jgi:hypothetical protein
MAERVFLTTVTLDERGQPLIVMLIPAEAGEPDFKLEFGPRSARQIAATLLEQAELADKLATVRPAGPTN